MTIDGRRASPWSSPPTTRARTSSPVLDRIFEAVTLPCEVLVVVDCAEDTTVPVVEKYADDEPRLRCVRQHLRPRAGERDPVRHRPRDGAGRRRDDGRRQRRPAPDRRSSTLLVERGVVVAAASRYMPGGQQVGGPLLKGLMSRTAGGRCTCFARVGTRDATNSFKAYSTEFVREVGIDSRRRVRDRHRADRQGPPAAAAGGRDPDDLARPRGGHVELQVTQWIRSTSAGTGSPSAGRSTAGQIAVRNERHRQSKARDEQA